VTVAVLLSDGVGLRNFVLGPFMRELAESTQVLALHAIDDDAVRLYAPLLPDGRVEWVPLASHHESVPSFMLRYITGEAHMYRCNTRAMRHNLQRQFRGSWKTRVARRTARRIAKVCANEAAIGRLAALHGKIAGSSAEVRHYRDLLLKHDVRVLFCSHQRPPFILPVVLAAKSIGVRTGTFIFSWDNLTTKARIAAPFDDYFVWSNLMRKELLTYYPNINEAQVHVIGTPQFDPYADPSLILSRTDFFARIGADPNRPLICYSGGDTGTCPEDQQHVRVILEEIRSGRIRDNPQVLLRPMPVDRGLRYQTLRDDFPELLYCVPDWVHPRAGNWSDVLPLPSDVQFLANLTTHCDLNVNVASTMTLDFAIHDKPIVNIAFDMTDPPVLGVPLAQLYYQYEHYRPVIELGATRVARSRGELSAHINEYLKDPSLDREGRAALVALEVGSPLGKSGKQLVERLTVRH
jgi:hypothetical protein